MSNLRFWLDDQNLKLGMRIQLPEVLAHRLIHVMRLKVGAQVRLFNGSGIEYIAELKAVKRRSVEVELQHERAATLPSPLDITLAQGVAKGEKMDWIVQKASELGATRLIPLFTQHCDMRLDDAQREKRMKHWEAVAVSAAEQSLRDLPMMIEQIADFERWLSGYATLDSGVTKILMAHPGGSSYGACGLKHWIAENGKCRKLAILIGPEGGWSPAELKLAAECRVQMIDLGPRILRTETAGPAIIAVLQAMLGDLSV